VLSKSRVAKVLTQNSMVIRMELLMILVLFVAMHRFGLCTRAPHIDLSSVF